MLRKYVAIRIRYRLRDRTKLRAALAAAAVVSFVAPAAAHHSFAVHFVADEMITVSGVVTEFSFRNPHGMLLVAVEDAGEQAEWKIETNSPNILRRRGWSETSIKAGDRVTVEGYPARDGSNFMRVYRVTYPDGRELVGQRPDPNAPSSED